MVACGWVGTPRMKHTDQLHHSKPCYLNCVLSSSKLVFRWQYSNDWPSFRSFWIPGQEIPSDDAAMEALWIYECYILNFWTILSFHLQCPRSPLQLEIAHRKQLLGHRNHLRDQRCHRCPGPWTGLVSLKIILIHSSEEIYSRKL